MKVLINNTRTTSFTTLILQRASFATSSSSNVNVGLVIKRNPILTKTLSSFEKAYLQYKEHISHTESRPFDPSFFIRKGSMAEKRWLDAQAQHQQELDEYHAKQNRNETDVLVDVQPKDPEFDTVSLSKRDDGSTTTESDFTSLNRAQDSALYLVVKPKNGSSWCFPTGPVQENELLHEAASSRIKEYLGTSMDTWVVGRVPIGAVSSSSSPTFFMKAHILAGSPRLNTAAFSEYAWMTKKELETEMKSGVFEDVKDMLSE